MHPRSPDSPGREQSPLVSIVEIVWASLTACTSEEDSVGSMGARVSLGTPNTNAKPMARGTIIREGY